MAELEKIMTMYDKNFYIIDESTLDTLKNTHIFNGDVLTDSKLERIEKMLNFTKKDERFIYTLTDIRWYDFLFFETSIGKIRVQLQNRSCNKCHSKYEVAIADYRLLYEMHGSVEESNRIYELEINKIKNNINSLKCPKCGSDFDCLVIWIDV